jgi:hypothetical protein
MNTLPEVNRFITKLLNVKECWAAVFWGGGHAEEASKSNFQKKQMLIQRNRGSMTMLNFHDRPLIRD